MTSLPWSETVKEKCTMKKQIVAKSPSLASVFIHAHRPPLSYWLLFKQRATERQGCSS